MISDFYFAPWSEMEEWELEDEYTRRLDVDEDQIGPLHTHSLRTKACSAQQRYNILLIVIRTFWTRD